MLLDFLRLQASVPYERSSEIIFDLGAVVDEGERRFLRLDVDPAIAQEEPVEGIGAFAVAQVIRDVQVRIENVRSRSLSGGIDVVLATPGEGANAVVI